MSASVALDVAVLQLSSADRVADNLEVLARLVGDVARRGAKLVVLPENFAFMGKDEDRRVHAERLGDAAAPIQALLSRLAREHSVTVVGGGMPERDPSADVPFNTAVVFDERDRPGNRTRITRGNAGSEICNGVGSHLSRTVAMRRPRPTVLIK